MPAAYTNGHASRADFDPYVALLEENRRATNAILEENRRANDAFRSEMVGAIRECTDAVKENSGEVRELRRQAPGAGALWALGAVVTLAMIAQFGMIYALGGGEAVHEVAEAVNTVAPAVP